VHLHAEKGLGSNKFMFISVSDYPEIALFAATGYTWTGHKKEQPVTRTQPEVECK